MLIIFNISLKMKNKLNKIFSKIRNKCFVDHLSEIDLRYIEEIRCYSSEDLMDVKSVEKLLLKLGTNDEILTEIPVEFHKYCGFGLKYWQYPSQFSQYLCFLSKYKISSYLEIGIRYGGIFILTLEYLKRFQAIKEAIGIEVLFNKSLSKYSKFNNVSKFIKIDSTSEEFSSLINDKKFDLVFSDGNHDEDYCRKDSNILKEKSKILVVRNIISDACSGVQKIYMEIKRNYYNKFNFYEINQQYDSIFKLYGKKYFGIGEAAMYIWI